ncbi:MAG: hypothetical protein J6B98_05615 [Bacilli bacterium]|nr:hypothetical protein [Bacilli bacterium]
MKKTNNIILLSITLLLCVVVIVLVFTVKDLTKKDDSLKDAPVNSEVVINNTDVEIYKSESSNYISYIVEDYERNLTYSWQFEKTNEKNNSVKENLILDINLRLSIDSDTDGAKTIEEEVDQKKLIVSFDHHGKLPARATVRINVSDRFKDNEKLYLYYYNPEKDQIEFIEKDLKVTDGYVEFTIDHCSDYFLTGAVVNNAVNNPKNINLIIIGLGVIVFILIVANLKQSKK